MNTFSVKDKVVVITGGGGALGGAAAKSLSGEGAKIVLLDRNEKAVDQSINENQH